MAHTFQRQLVKEICLSCDVDGNTKTKKTTTRMTEFDIIGLTQQEP